MPIIPGRDFSTVTDISRRGPCRRARLGSTLEGLDRDIDPNRHEPIAIPFANQAPEALQTAAYNRLFDLLFAAEHFPPPGREPSAQAKPRVLRNGR